MARIVILIGMHLSTAPRAQKEALALTQLGHDVRILGTWSHEATIAYDEQLLSTHEYLRYKAALDFRPARKLTNLLCRLEHRLAKELYTYFRIVTPSLYGYAPRAILKAATVENADLTIAHSEATMWVARKLQQRGKTVGVDLEDWFSRDGNPAPPHRSELEAMERDLLQTSDYATTTSRVLAEALAQRYEAPRPTVIYNTFPLKDRDSLDGQYKDRKNRDIPSLHWFSQTIGPGRGVETLLQAMAAIAQPLELHLRGTLSLGFLDAIRPLIEHIPQHTVFFHDIVSNEELLSRIAEHDIGFALEEKDVESRTLTVTNKIFQYMLAGVGVIASDTPGQLEVMRPWAEDAQNVRQNDIESLSASIRHYVENPEALQRIKILSLEAAENEYHFEKQIERYEALLQRVIDNA